MKRVMSIVVALLLTAPLASAQQNGGVSVQSLPPVVVKTVPESGDTQVDPAIQVILKLLGAAVLASRVVFRFSSKCAVRWQACSVDHDRVVQ